jgi:hypothetical protein
MYISHMSTNDYLDYFFGPLPEIYCYFFYGMSVLMAFFFVIVLIAFINSIISSNKTTQAMRPLYFFALVGYFVYYFVFRILNTMCMKSL